MLNETLAYFARTIVQGEHPPPQIDTAYPNYALNVAIEVYRNNYRGNLHDALAGVYPVIKQLVGDDFFRFMSRKFIERHPSSSANLHQYGAELSGFLRTFAPAQELPYLPHVAALEWACHCAYFADNATTLDIGKLAQILPERYSDLTLLIHPACHVLRSRYPVAAIWNAHQPGAPGDFHIDLDSGPCRALVIRQDNRVQVSELAVSDAEWLSCIQAGTHLGTATANTLEKYPDFDLRACLLHLMTLGIFTDFNVEEVG